MWPSDQEKAEEWPSVFMAKDYWQYLAILWRSSELSILHAKYERFESFVKFKGKNWEREAAIFLKLSNDASKAGENL